MSRLELLCLLCLILQCPLSSLSNSEGDALSAFRRRVSDPNNVLQSWDPTLVNPCTWLRVSCDSNDNVVLRIYLGNSGLSGTLGPELAQLPSLQHLHLFGNNLSGNIPQELGSLKNLISMDLSKNKLEGNIPESFANLESLKFLWLDNNELSGTIPSAVVTLLKNLEFLNVSNNHFSNPPVDVTAQSFSMQSFGNKKFRSARVKGVVA
ncbi:leucine-rich repeat protein 1-like [Phaseolus vulgaris]|uniref:leucine-rich repeat protein 1-like n=1 Tax=Phaseolus vulgaris TaxID=3885 RepID=UPI0035CA041D